MLNGFLKSTQRKNKCNGISSSRPFIEVSLYLPGSLSDEDMLSVRFRIWPYVALPKMANKLSAIKLYIEKPHLVNKKIFGSTVKWVGIGGICFDEELASEIRLAFHSDNTDLNSLIGILNQFKFETSKQETMVKDLLDIPGFPPNRSVVVRSILPRYKSCCSILEVIIIDLCCNEISFITEEHPESYKILPSFTYTINFADEKLNLKTSIEQNPNDSCYKWLSGQLLPTLIKWADQMESAGFLKGSTSLHLVNLNDYSQTYQELKSKYAKHLQEIWTETTDPLKYIYEDIAIAAYLLVLWSEERREKKLSEKQSFVDLGCGNGLLVYLLSSEGYPGMGIDIRRRKIWDNFHSHVCLKEEVILPSDEHLYPHFDWLIGNHSDELTPWLPVIAAKSSFSTRFFVIPCCAHDFQTKFQRKKSGMSQYTEYLDYVESIAKTCGFEVLRDRLRIPSTKRTCFIGKTRKYDKSQWSDILEDINRFLSQKTTREIPLETGDSNQLVIAEGETCLKGAPWCLGFKAKDRVEKVRNCTQLKPQIRDELVNEIAFLLLSQPNFILVKRSEEFVQWNRGGDVSMKNLAMILDAKLKSLKKECGGLQTLLRNHKFIFEMKEGIIRLRIPESIEKRKVAPELLKTKKCWFYLHHPQGCVLKNEHCTYEH